MFYNISVAQIISVTPETHFNIVAGITIAADGLEMTPSSDCVLNAGITKATSITNNATFNCVPRVYQFDQTRYPFNGTLKIYYLDSELSELGFTESTLKILYHNGAWAIDNSSTTDETTNSTSSGTLINKSLNEIILGICLSSSCSLATKFSNQSTHARFLSPTLHTWSILPGLDAGTFSLDSNYPQQLTFNSFANYANPNDSNRDNGYLVNVTDGCETKSLTITISPFCGNWN
jgi:hypothetical protein